jgi:hypothetical protein
VDSFHKLGNEHTVSTNIREFLHWLEDYRIVKKDPVMSADTLSSEKPRREVKEYSVTSEPLIPHLEY